MELKISYNGWEKHEGGAECDASHGNNIQMLHIAWYSNWEKVNALEVIHKGQLLKKINSNLMHIQSAESTICLSFAVILLQFCITLLAVT